MCMVGTVMRMRLPASASIIIYYACNIPTKGTCQVAGGNEGLLLFICQIKNRRKLFSTVAGGIMLEEECLTIRQLPRNSV